MQVWEVVVQFARRLNATRALVPNPELPRQQRWLLPSGSVQAIFLAAIFLLANLGQARADNPISTPIADRGLQMHVQPFALVLGEGGTVLRLNTIVTVEDRLFVTAEEGQVYEITDGDTSLAWDFTAAWPNAAGRSLSFDTGWHSGLRGIAFSPNFSSDQKIYAAVMEDRPSKPSEHHYISDVANPVGGDSVISEWTLVGGELDPGSYRELFRVGMPVYDHPVKDLAFGPDGMLYITHGDASVQSAIAGGGMNNDALGKILRIDPTPSGGLQYTVPSDNPFVTTSSMIDEAWSIGHRNPHTLSFSDDGVLLVGEVGRDNVEEINLILKGANYGWPEREGTFVHLASGGLITGVEDLPSNDASFGYTYPVAQFGHEGEVGAGFVGQAVAGGVVVENGSPMDGEYLFAEFATLGEIYHVSMSDVLSATTQGAPGDLTQANPARATIWFDHDSNEATAALPRASMVDVVDDAANWTGDARADTRFGRGPGGEVYLSSKRNGLVYLISSTVPGGPGGFVDVVRIEAETGTPIGAANISTVHAGFSGSGMVENLIGTGSGVTGLLVEQGAADTVSLNIAYAMGPSPVAEGTLGVLVNGVRVATAVFAPTESWATYSLTSLDVPLAAGENTVDFVVEAGDTGWVNLDYFTVTGATGAAPAGAVEAESGVMAGSAEVSSQHAGYSGTGMVEDVVSVGSGVTGLVLTTASAGTAELNVRYAMGPEAPVELATLGVVVNGSRQATLEFTSTGDWATWSNSSTTIDLAAGDNEIDLLYQAGDTGWVNLDYVWLSDAEGPGPTPAGAIEAESGDPVGSAGISTEHAGYSGTGMVDDIVSVGSGVTGLVLTSSSAGAAELNVRYAMGPQAPAEVGSLGIIVNGERQTTIEFESTGAWSSWADASATVSLVDGDNQIDLLYQTGDTGWVNLDYVWTSDAEGPAPTPLGAVEAESGEPAGSSGISTEHAGFSGTGMIDDIISVGSGVTGLSLAAASSGAAELHVQYAMGPQAPVDLGALGVIVNGARQTTIEFEPTGAWTNWSSSSVTAYLGEGVNQIDLLYQSGDTGWVNLDYVWLDDAEGPLPVPTAAVEAETGVPACGAVIASNHAGFSGDGMIASIISEGRGVTDIIVSSDATETKVINVRYAHGAGTLTGTLGVLVDGTRQTTAAFAPTGSWSGWATTSVTVDLIAGDNTIDFLYQSGDSGWVNLDYVWVSNPTALEAKSSTREVSTEDSGFDGRVDGGRCATARAPGHLPDQPGWSMLLVGWACWVRRRKTLRARHRP